MNENFSINLHITSRGQRGEAESIGVYVWCLLVVHSMSQLALAPSFVDACLEHCHFLFLAVLCFFCLFVYKAIFSWTIAGGGQPKSNSQLLAGSRIFHSFVYFGHDSIGSPSHMMNLH